jgi:hypothetical protein
MVKNICLSLLALFLCQVSFAKSVDEQTAKTAGYNFFTREGISADPAAMSLVYKATSQVNGMVVTDFYVFSAGNNGFIIVSGDDNVTPVLGYSAESPFRAEHIPGSVSQWLDNYKNQINYIIEHNIVAGDKTVAGWAALQQGISTKRAERTTGSTVYPLVSVKWDQAPYYNGLCPFDASADANAVTGCVATAMAQVMKYWNWPKKGTGSNTYSSPYGMLTANFAATTYMWDSMPNIVTKKNSYVATLMLHAGIGVNMHYSATESGAFVNSAYSPVTNCAEYALKNYFGYKKTMKGAARDAYDDSTWLNLIKSEIDAKRPVIYTGDGNVGGHCFIADGYTTANRLHINWGWGVAYSGYYVFDNLAPGGSDFNSNQTLLYGITPDNPAALDVTAVDKTAIDIYPNPASDKINVSLQDAKDITIRLADMQGRILKLITPADNMNNVEIPVSDLAAGMYFVSLQTAKGVETKKIIVAK